jgi:hypothetical protein
MRTRINLQEFFPTPARSLDPQLQTGYDRDADTTVKLLEDNIAASYIVEVACLESLDGMPYCQHLQFVDPCHYVFMGKYSLCTICSISRSGTLQATMNRGNRRKSVPERLPQAIPHRSRAGMTNRLLNMATEGQHGRVSSSASSTIDLMPFIGFKRRVLAASCMILTLKLWRERKPCECSEYIALLLRHLDRDGLPSWEVWLTSHLGELSGSALLPQLGHIRVFLLGY